MCAMDVKKLFKQADAAYFNGSLPKFGTRGSTIVSASKYLNSGALRDMTAQEMLRRNRPDVTPTAFIAEINALLMEMVDWPRIRCMHPRSRISISKAVLSPQAVGTRLRPGNLSGEIIDLPLREIVLVRQIPSPSDQTQLGHQYR